MSNQLTKMARELLVIEEDLPRRLNYKGNLYPKPDNFDLLTFNQTWGSTALGFGGMGGSMMTTARTYVFIPSFGCEGQKCFVYFGDRFAYSVDYSDVFMDDVRNRWMEPVYKIGKYELNEE